MKGVKGFKKGEGGRKKGSLNKTTLTMLERRALFDQRAQEKLDEWIDSVRPEYGLDQYIGSATQKVEHSGEIKTGTPLPAEAIAIIEADLKKKKTE